MGLPPRNKFLSLTAGIAAESVNLFIGIYLELYPMMASLRRFSRFAAVASAAVTFSGAYIVFNSTRNPARASADTSPGFESYPEEFADRHLVKPSGLRWDPNWDMCNKGEKKSKKKDNGKIEEESKEIKPTAVRHLVFIRHGQYYLDAANDDDKRLTELGRLQANTTGQRLKDLCVNLKYTKLVCSTLIRAIETADIIASYLPDVPRETCCMLREGAPIKPDPSSPNWKPEKKVSVCNSEVDREF